MSTDRVGKHERLWFLLKLLVSLAILSYLATILDWRDVGARLGRMHPRDALLPPSLLLLGMGIAALRWRLLLSRVGVGLTFWTSYRYYLIGNLYNVVLPGVIGGDAVRIALCSVRRKGSLALVAITTLAERLLGALALVLVGTTAMILMGGAFRLSLLSSLRETLDAPLVATLAAIAGAVTVALGLRRLGRSRSGRRSALLERLVEALNQLLSIPVTSVLTAVLLSVGFQIPDGIASFVLANALGIDLPLVVFFALNPVLYFTTNIPISVGGLGVREGVMVLLLTSLDVSASAAILFALSVYVNRVFVSMIGGVVQIGEPFLAGRPSRGPEEVS